MITAIAQFNGNEYEGSGFTQREAKNEAARSLLKEMIFLCSDSCISDFMQYEGAAGPPRTRFFIVLQIMNDLNRQILIYNKRQ